MASSNYNLSKKMAYRLRHGQNLPQDGFMFVDELLSAGDFRGFTEQDVIKVVQECKKKRFQLQTDEGTRRLKVRAVQGHSQNVDLGLELITNPTRFCTVVHGTRMSNWNTIRSEGLNKRGRQHIHFAIGLPGDQNVTSGMPAGCDVAIYIDLAAAIRGGLKFYKSSNDVILCSGDTNGCIRPQYFQKVINMKTNQRLQ